MPKRSQSYARLASSKYHNLAAKYLPEGAGAVLTFGVKGGFEASVRLVEGVDLFSHLANIGDTHSLILHPASTTHHQLTEEQRITAGVGSDVVRPLGGPQDPRRPDPRPRPGPRSGVRRTTTLPHPGGHAAGSPASERRVRPPAAEMRTFKQSATYSRTGYCHPSTLDMSGSSWAIPL